MAVKIAFYEGPVRIQFDDESQFGAETPVQIDLPREVEDTLILTEAQTEALYRGLSRLRHVRKLEGR